MENFERTKKICDTWLFNKKFSATQNVFDLASLNILYDHFQHIDFSPFLDAFSQRLKTVNYTFSTSAQVSGGVCFFGGVFTSLLNFGHVSEIEDLFTFVLGYMLIDHFLDDVNISESEKEENIKDIKNFLFFGIISKNGLIDSISYRYTDLINRKPFCKPYFLKLFSVELETFNLQSCSNKNHIYNREIYDNIAKEKGGWTSLCIASIIGLLEGKCTMDFHISHYKNNPHFILGSIIQYVDDLLDLKDDMDNNIYTLARYDIENTNWDNYIHKLCEDINNLDSTYNFFKIILLNGIILAVHDNPNSVSSELHSLLENYDLFGGSTKYSLINWFYGKLGNLVQYISA